MVSSTHYPKSKGRLNRGQRHKKNPLLWDVDITYRIPYWINGLKWNPELLSTFLVDREEGHWRKGSSKPNRKTKVMCIRVSKIPYRIIGPTVREIEVLTPISTPVSS